MSVALSPFCLSGRAAWGRLATLAVACTLAGCVTLELQSADGQVQVVRHVGVLQVTLAQPTATSIAGSVSGVGLVSAPLGLTLGYTRQRWALLGADCRAIVWAPETGLDEAARASLKRTAGLCQSSDGSHPAAGSAALAGVAP